MKRTLLVFTILLSVLRLPNSYQPNTKREIAAVTPSREDVGLPASGFVFCCFNNGYKITPPPKTSSPS